MVRFLCGFLGLCCGIAGSLVRICQHLWNAVRLHKPNHYAKLSQESPVTTTVIGRQALSGFMLFGVRVIWFGGLNMKIVKL